MFPIFGVDFSGGAFAGEKIWVCRAQTDGQKFEIESVTRGAELENSGAAREIALKALVSHLETGKGALIGFDFPFSLEKSAFQNQNWRDWLPTVARDFSDAQNFREAFPDARRECDIKAKTPFSPLNLRLFRQTFHGIRDVLLPLVERGAVVLPQMELKKDAQKLIEICPASLLKREKLYFSYKGKSELQKNNRARIWDEMRARSGFSAPPEIERACLNDAEGDALDAVLAAICAFNAAKIGDFATRDETEALEGRVYF